MLIAEHFGMILFISHPFSFSYRDNKAEAPDRRDKKFYYIRLFSITRITLNYSLISQVPFASLNLRFE